MQYERIWPSKTFSLWLPIPSLPCREESSSLSLAAAGQIWAVFQCCCQEFKALESVWTVQAHAGALPGCCYLVGSGCNKEKKYTEVLCYVTWLCFQWRANSSHTTYCSH
ncbi:unnamed protein product [Meganyctiphanes norvegica]|uniref:Uncharacterized protein n=1 Tax=Meganyctiphanes norvegica TaxID=48144 RepID=A0AAV2Q7T7_MEGNR